jgi:hypothetical protein
MKVWNYFTDSTRNKSYKITTNNDFVVKETLPIDVSKEIKDHFITFRNDLTLMPGLASAFGGIQEVTVKGYLKKWIPEVGTFDKKLKPNILNIKLVFELKDWFGVDEQDVFNNDLPAQIDREGLAAFGVLQHQRGYPPFINIIDYQEDIEMVWYE